MNILTFHEGQSQQSQISLPVSDRDSQAQSLHAPTAIPVLSHTLDHWELFVILLPSVPLCAFKGSHWARQSSQDNYPI